MNEIENNFQKDINSSVYTVDHSTQFISNIKSIKKQNLTKTLQTADIIDDPFLTNYLKRVIQHLTNSSGIKGYDSIKQSGYLDDNDSLLDNQSTRLENKSIGHVETLPKNTNRNDHLYSTSKNFQSNTEKPILNRSKKPTKKGDTKLFLTPTKKTTHEISFQSPLVFPESDNHHNVESVVKTGMHLLYKPTISHYSTSGFTSTIDFSSTSGYVTKSSSKRLHQAYHHEVTASTSTLPVKYVLTTISPIHKISRKPVHKPYNDFDLSSNNYMIQHPKTYKKINRNNFLSTTKNSFRLFRKPTKNLHEPTYPTAFLPPFRHTHRQTAVLPATTHLNIDTKSNPKFNPTKSKNNNEFKSAKIIRQSNYNECNKFPGMYTL